jgi:hypothetical protein
VYDRAVRSRTIGVVVAVLVLAGPLAPARAEVTPSVTVRLVDEGLDAQLRRTVRVDVSGSCGPAAGPRTTMELLGSLRGRWAGEKHPPYELDAGQLTNLGPDESQPGPAASFRFRISGGVVAAAGGWIQCSDPDALEGTGQTASAESPWTGALAAPIQLLGWHGYGTTVTFRRPSCKLPRNAMQVHAGYDIEWQLNVDARGLLGTRRLAPSVFSKLTFHIAGGGVRRIDFHPSKKGWAAYHTLLNGFYYTPRRLKPVRLWVTAGGMDSVVRTVKVKPKPKGC